MGMMAAAGFNLSLSSSRGPGDDGSGWHQISEENPAHTRLWKRYDGDLGGSMLYKGR